MADDNRRNYYRILHVQPDAPTEVIKSSYRTLMQRLKMHPDLGGDHAEAALINEAYAVLTDPDKRAAYDRDLPQPQRASAAETTPEPEPEPTPEADPGTARRQRAAGSGGPHHCPFCHEGHKHKVIRNQLCRECGSPLLRIRNPRKDAAWLRAVERMPAEMPMRYWTAWPQAQPREGRVVDLSLTGLRFIAPEALAKDHFIKLHSDLIQAIARVVHCRTAEGGWQIGAEFVTLQFARTRGAFVSDQA